MKYRPLLALALLLAPTSTIIASPSSKEGTRERLEILRTTPDQKPTTLIESAYLDASSILENNNRCGLFFGGKDSRQVLTELVIGLREQTISDTRIGVRMWGNLTMFEPREGFFYRLFEHTELNSLGAFFNSKTFPSQPYVPNVGSFRPNTREARVLILLHELAHLIKGSGEMWLIPDDGDSPQVSRVNTRKIESLCGRQIRSL